MKRFPAAFDLGVNGLKLRLLTPGGSVVIHAGFEALTS
jgi:hypothetical protein